MEGDLPPSLHGEAEEQPGEAAGPVPPGRGESVRPGPGRAAGAGGDGAGVADAAGRAGEPAVPQGQGGPGTEQSVIEEYERSLQFDEECLNAMLDGLDASDKIICPVCRQNNLTVRNHFVFCQCGLYISTQGMTEEKLRALLEHTVTEHSHRCFHNPEFTVTSGMEEETSLLMSCSVCDSWTILL
ncbi:RPA-interacting protein isoform X2 [Nyctibius grandis]|uniref:RPA-interacting protein isoform X2 n=1 Tax=Nyctibius grandis TaxID=48427 RepID=UPI0035BBEB90